MKIYTTSGDTEHYQPLRFDIPKDGDLLTFHKPGEPFGESWTPLPVTLTKIDNRKTKFKVKSRLIADFPEMGIHACYTRRAIDALGENYLRQYGELLPFKSADGVEYFWFNFTNTIDAFDESNSKFDRLESNGNILHVYRHAYFADRIGTNEMFMEKNNRYRLVTDSFKARVEAAGLTGMLFKPLWSDDPVELAKIYEES
jgi:hypothetical protein